MLLDSASTTTHTHKRYTPAIQVSETTYTQNNSRLSKQSIMGAVLSFFGRIIRAIGNGIMGLISLIGGFLNAIVSAITDLFVCIFTCGRGSRRSGSRRKTRAGGL